LYKRGICSVRCLESEDWEAQIDEVNINLSNFL